MIDYLGMVKEFHTKYGHYTSPKPHSRLNISQETMLLRDRLIAEEIDEFASAVSPTDIADALGDILYVVFGAALAYGIPINEVFAEIHRSNMTKSTLKDEFGKTIKGEYEPARIAMILQGEPRTGAGSLD